MTEYLHLAWIYLVPTWSFIVSILSYNDNQPFKTEFKQLKTYKHTGFSELLCLNRTVSLWEHKQVKMVSFQNQKALTTRCSSLNITGGITLRPSFGKNICIILSRSSQVALRNTPLGSLTTMKRSWKTYKNKKSIISQSPSLFIAIVKKIHIWQSPSIPKPTPISSFCLIVAVH